MKTLDQVDIKNKRVLIRADLNVPIRDGKVTSDARIKASVPTIRHALDSGAAVMVMSHLGRPEEGEFDSQYSLAPVAEKLGELLGEPCELVSDWIDGVDVQPGKVVLLENVRFLKGEKDNDDDLAKKMAALCDVFVMDAFATAHRAQASTEGVIRHSKTAVAGPLLARGAAAVALGVAATKAPAALSI